MDPVKSNWIVGACDEKHSHPDRLFRILAWMVSGILEQLPVQQYGELDHSHRL
jgi:hypothetical protein